MMKASMRHLCQWLWKLTAFLGISVILALILNIFATWLITSKGTFPQNTPLSDLMKQWPLLLLGACCLLLLALIFWLGSRDPAPSSTSSTQMSAQNRKHLWGRLNVLYQQMSEQSLQEAVRIELNFVSQPAALDNAVSLALRLPHQPERPFPTGTTILQVYNQAQQELLILGAPGAGKSTFLIELAQHLTKQAEQDEMQPLPALIPLSTWAEQRLPLQEWFIGQFTELYTIPSKLSRQWIEAGLILPLLDGLDEMDEALRPACIAAINGYHQAHLGPLVVCSRTNEYATASQTEQLNLQQAVVVQPLTPQQIEARLTQGGKRLTGLHTAYKHHVALRELATTPLLLNLFILTYQDTPVRNLPTTEEALQHLMFDRYVQRMVEQKGKRRTTQKGENPHYSLTLTTHWLTFLAIQMRLHNQTVFAVEWLQPSWLPRGLRLWYKISYELIVGLSYGLIYGLSFGLISGLIYGLSYKLIYGLSLGLIYGLIIGLITGLISVRQESIYLAERITWSWRNAERLLIAGLIAGLILGLIYGLSYGLIYGLSYGLILGLILGLSFGLITGLSSKQVVERHTLSPGEGLIHSLKNGLILGLITGLSFGLIVRLIFGLSYGLSYGLIYGLSYGLSFGLEAGLRHMILRFWLWRAGVFPLRTITFLEDARARYLLKRVGGTYQFMHSLLMDYFVGLDTTQPRSSSTTTTPDPTTTSSHHAP